MESSIFLNPEDILCILLVLQQQLLLLKEEVGIEKIEIHPERRINFRRFDVLLAEKPPYPFVSFPFSFQSLPIPRGFP